MTQNIGFDIAIVFGALMVFWTVVLILQRFSIDPVPETKRKRIVRVLVFDVILGLVALLWGVFMS
jgi:hypothetical protein